MINPTEQQVSSAASFWPFARPLVKRTPYCLRRPAGVDGPRHKGDSGEPLVRGCRRRGDDRRGPGGMF
ncbi:hypothetical protein I552_3475 [Mycobacterium xenopi 3993]|nr:hypothetical protein I552_3475 [Mycobacterium xenopi 3993]